VMRLWPERFSRSSWPMPWVSDILSGHDHTTREAAIEMAARAKCFENPNESVTGVIYGRTYRVEEWIEDPAPVDESVRI